jgi:hypothetical protein
VTVELESTRTLFFESLIVSGAPILHALAFAVVQVLDYQLRLKMHDCTTVNLKYGAGLGTERILSLRFREKLATQLSLDLFDSSRKIIHSAKLIYFAEFFIDSISECFSRIH